MSRELEAVSGWFAAFYQSRGFVVTLQAFYDETGGDENANITAVSGFLFNKEGLERFTEQWPPLVAGLSKPYRSSSCHGGYAPFDSAREWPDQRRQSLMDQLAQISCNNALAGFIATTTKADFQAALENSPGMRKLVDSPYALCVLTIFWQMKYWADEFGRGEPINYWFEKGAFHEKETQAIITRIERNPEVASKFYLGEYAWLPKGQAPAFCAGDLLAWEWQRNIARSSDVWTPRMKMIMDRLREQSKPLFSEHLTANTATLWGMFNSFHKLHKD